MADRAAPKDPMPRAPRRPVSLPTHRQAIARRSALSLLPFEPRGSGRQVAPSAPFAHAAALVQQARLDLAGVPMSGGIRSQRTPFERSVGGSAILHLILFVLLAVLYARQSKLPPPSDQQPVEMVYGQSGMKGDPVSPEFGGGSPPTHEAPPPAQPAPETPATPAPTPAPQEPTVNTNLMPPPPPIEIPEFLPLPPPPPPTPDKPQDQPAKSQQMRIPLRTARSSAKSSPSSAFSHPMDLSFSQVGPPRSRTGRVGGSHAPIDMSLGPLVKNGRLNTPFATVGIKGVSNDYGNEIDAWIRRHLYYPPDAAQRGEDGQASVHVVIDRDGHVKSVRLVSSSSSFALDDSTQGMFRNAKLPEVPPDMQGDHFDIDLTVNYILTH